MDVRKKLVELIDDALQRKEGTARVVGKQYVNTIADHLIANGVTVQEWISVKDRLPDELSKERFIVTNGQSVSFTYRNYFYRDGHGNLRVPAHYGQGMNVTHFMPLPELPKGE